MPETIFTSRLLLRPPAQDDHAAIVRYLNNYEVSKNTGRVPYPYGLADASEFLDRSAEGNASGAAIFLALAERASPSHLIGVISVERDGEDQRSAELGYWLAEPFWGRGFMREAAKAVTTLAFTDIELTRLHACYHLGNEASRRILMGLGFMPMKRCTSFSQAQGRDVDMEELELLREAYAAQQKGEAFTSPFVTPVTQNTRRT